MTVSDLRTGDVLLHRPRGIIGLAIAALQWKWPSWRPFSHAAPVWVVGGIGHALDAQGGGTALTPVADQVAACASIVVRRVPEAVRAAVLPAVLEDRAERWFLGQIGTRYPYTDLLGFLWRCPLSWTPNGAEDKPVKQKLVCSALTSATLRYLFAPDYDPVPECSDRWTSPSDLAATDALVTVTRELQA